MRDPYSIVQIVDGCWLIALWETCFSLSAIAPGLVQRCGLVTYKGPPRDVTDLSGFAYVADDYVDISITNGYESTLHLRGIAVIPTGPHDMLCVASDVLRELGAQIDVRGGYLQSGDQLFKLETGDLEVAYQAVNMDPELRAALMEFDDQRNSDLSD